MKAILTHLLRCISSDNEVETKQLRPRGQKQAMSPGTDVPLDYIDIKSIPPLPMYALLAADRNVSEIQLVCPQTTKVEPNYNALFEGPKFVELELESSTSDLGLVETESAESDAEPSGLQFGQKQSVMMSNYLMRVQLPGLSRLDQMYLVALSETVATENLNEHGVNMQYGLYIDQ